MKENKMTKRMVRTLIDSIETHGSVNYLLEKLNGLVAHSEGKLDYEIYSTTDEYGDRYSYFDVYGYKEESDEVYQKRMALVKCWKVKQDASEKAAYERLKAKFGE